jgi:hypothetical protein
VKFVHFVSWSLVAAVAIDNCRKAAREAEGEAGREALGTPIKVGRATAKAKVGAFLTPGVEERSYSYCALVLSSTSCEFDNFVAKVSGASLLLLPCDGFVV